MPENAQHHVLVITTDEDDCEGFDFEIECPGVTADCPCQMWWDCSACASNDLKGRLDSFSDANDLGEGVCAGVLHRRIDGRLIVPTNHCFVAEADNTFDAVHELGNLQPGRYEIGFSFADDVDLVLELIESTASADAF